MVETKHHLMNADEVADRLSIKRSGAYKIIRELNQVMEDRGCKVIPGRVSSEILEEVYFVGKIREEGDSNDRKHR